MDHIGKEKIVKQFNYRVAKIMSFKLIDLNKQIALKKYKI